MKLNKLSNLDRTIQSTFSFEAPIPKTERYNNSFVPKTLRALSEASKKKSLTQPETTD